MVIVPSNVPPKFINQAIQALGFDSVDMYRKHLEKSNVNRKRQKDGYKY